MKIFLISNLYPSKVDRDYGIFVKNIEDELVELGIEVSQKAVISGRSKSFWSKINTYRKFYTEILRAYRKNNFDLIYIHFLSHSSPGLMTARFLMGKKKKFVVNVHGSDILKYNKGILKWFNNKLIRETERIIVPSRYFREIIEETFPDFPTSKIYISPSGGVDFSVFNFRNRNKNELFHLGFVSRIEEEKGWRTFLNALFVLNEKNIPFNASIAGTGSQVEEMKSIIRKYKLNNQVKYLDVLSHQQLSNLYNELDLFVFPSELNESLGLVGLEAMACGVPVIGSNIAGIKTFIEHNQNGYFFSPGNEIELVDKIITYYELSEQEKHMMKDRAIKTARKYDRKKVIKELYKEFQKLLD